MKKNIVLLGMVSVLLVGCIKPYDKPEYEEITTSQTGFVIPLEGESKEQAKFDSESYLEQRKIAAKRVQIPHRWNQTGRFSNQGEWIDTVRVIKVDRSPVTRQWSVTDQAQAEGNRTATGAIWIESSDSIGFSMGFNCTAYIAEKDAARFLYWYRGDSLSSVMDTEIKARYQQAAAEVAAGEKMDDLRSKKQSIVDAIRRDIIPFFAERGITITTVGQFGGAKYQNKEIQEAIDKTFIAQQQKVVSEALLAAQNDINLRIESEAKALANKARETAKGTADGELEIARAESQRIEMVNKALEKARENPVFVRLKELEVEQARVKAWNGAYPVNYFGGGGSGGPTVVVPLDLKK